MSRMQIEQAKVSIASFRKLFCPVLNRCLHVRLCVNTGKEAASMSRLRHFIPIWRPFASFSSSLNQLDGISPALCCVCILLLDFFSYIDKFIRIFCWFFFYSHCHYFSYWIRFTAISICFSLCICSFWFLLLPSFFYLTNILFSWICPSLPAVD